MNTMEIYIVLDESFEDGSDAYAFRTEKEAWDSVDGDVERAKKHLTDMEIPFTEMRRPDGVELYVPSGSQFYGWTIYKSYLL